MNFGTRIADAQTNLEKEGFAPTLWAPQWDVPAEEAEAFMPPHEPQMLAALQVFAWLFVSSVQRVWVHLAAEMQAGKTGVIAAVARLVLSNARRLGFTPTRIFVVTGMSDEAWQKQTAPRLPGILRENVHHGGTLSQVAVKLARLAGDGILSNVLIFIDESHYAASANNQPARHVYEAVARVCPRELWSKNNIRFVTISATDPAKVLAMKSSEMPCQVVRLYTTPAYQSVEKLQASGRIQFLEQIPQNGTLHSESGFEALSTAVRTLEATHGPLIHILRPSHGKGGDVASRLRRAFPEAIVRPWDVAANKERKSRDESSSGIGSVTDINAAILNDKPLTTTFVLLKGMFRAAKTLNDEHVGVLYDRVGSGDATNLQSLLGRACGYGKSMRTVVFASSSTVSNYLRLWRELCASKDFPTEGKDDAFSKLTGRMPGVTTVMTASGDATKLVTTASHATPLGSGVGSATKEERSASDRAKNNDDLYTVEWSQEYRTIEELKANYPGLRKLPQMGESGFYRNPWKPGPMTRTQIDSLKSGRKTTNMTTASLVKSGDSTQRIYPFYMDTSDPSTVRFIVRKLTLN